MNKWGASLLLAWAVSATIALAWTIGRNSAPPVDEKAPVRAEPAMPVAPPSAPASSADPKAKEKGRTYPDYRSTIPQPFRGRWDELIADRCESREARFYFGEREFANFEVMWEVTKVKLYSPTEMDLHTTLKDEDGSQVDEIWEFRLVDRGRTLTGRKRGASFFKRCPDTGSSGIAG